MGAHTAHLSLLRIVSVCVCIHRRTLGITSPEACARASPDGKHGLSGGWIFIILFFVAVILYFLCGCLFKHYRQGTMGLESTPNVDFWRELPGLLKDGCIFFGGLCRDAVQM
jgi:hypothetical protein